MSCCKPRHGAFVVIFCLMASLAVAQVKVPVWVEAAVGGRRTDLSPKRFEAFIDDQPVAVRSVLGPSDNLVLLLVLDLTGDLARVDALRGALDDALPQLGARHFVGVLQAQDGLKVLHDPTADRKAILGRIHELNVAGKAGLLDSLEPTAEIAGGILRRAAVRVAVLYLTDSKIANYRADFVNPVINASDRSDLSRRFPDRLIQERTARLTAALESCTAPIFVLHLESSSGGLDEAYQNGLKQIAEATAGEAVFCRTPAEIPAALNQMLLRIRSGYTLMLDTAASASRGARLRITAGETHLVFRNRLLMK